VLRCGAAYVPLDPAFPAARLRYISADADLDVALSDRDLPAGISAQTRVRLDWDARQISRQPARTPTGPVDSATPAYVMHTSGSTGYPKGVVVSHRNVVNLFAGMDQRVGIGQGDTMLALTTASFDPSVLELLWPLTRGATVAVADGDPGRFTDLCGRHRPSHFQATPTFLSAVTAHPRAMRALSRLRVLLCGGEALSSRLAAALMTGLPGAAVFNMYGPTETTVWSTVHPLDRGRDIIADVLPIGRPIANTAVRVVRPDGTDAAVGVAGELWIGGDGVAAGYLSKPELTADRFVENASGRWYRTGDLVRWRNGSLEFLGRIDRQVKVAGHRVELEEVESVLSRHPAVASAAVVAAERPGQAELHAYVRLLGESSAPDLRAFVSERLPAPMVPTRFVILAELPTLPNGKIDRSQLPAAEDAQSTSRKRSISR